MVFEKSLRFLQLLSQNNNREWYHANKNLYLDAKTEFEQVTEILLHEMQGIDKNLAGLLPKDCIFRIFRDVRFSKDKSPYKINFGTFLTPGGRKAGNAGYYLHIQPGESFVAGGVYMPPAPVLKAVREEIFEHAGEFKDIIRSLQEKSKFEEMFGDKLRSAPKGFPKDFEDIDLLKYKSYGLSKSIPDKAFKKEFILQDIINDFKSLFPLVRFINEAIRQGV